MMPQFPIAATPATLEISPARDSAKCASVIKAFGTRPDP
jgi:hypothetical protein